MSDDCIKQIVSNFRLAIEKSRDAHQFDNSDFMDFPRDCCGQTCSILAKYLFENHGINTLWVSSARGLQSHAWLVLKDGRVSEPQTPDLISRQ